MSDSPGSGTQYPRSWQDVADDLLPSPSTGSSPSSGFSSGDHRVNAHVSIPMTSSDANQRVVTVRDLRDRSCWICTEEDEDRSPASRRRFIHPCKCTLVAHESCLLRWVEQTKANNPLQHTFTCPQCKASYVMIDKKSSLLKLFELLDRLLDRAAVPFGAAVILGGSVLIASTAYGCVALRLVLGKDAARRLLASPWPWHYWLDIPIIPFALVAEKLRLFGTRLPWVPTLIVGAHFPIVLSHYYFVDRVMESFLQVSWHFPPSPTLTAVLVPWVRAFYLAFKRKVYKAVLGHFYRKAGLSSYSSNSEVTSTSRRQIVVLGEFDAYRMVDVDPPPGAEGVIDGNAGQQDGQENTATRTLYVTHTSVSRLCLGALGLPVIANVMGQILARAARHSRLLARFLGIKVTQTASSSFFTQFTTTRTSKSTPSPLASLFRGSLPSYDRDESPFDRISGRLSYGDHMQRSDRVEYDDLDPVWFRNAVGAALFVVLRDAGSLLYKVLKLQQRSQTRITDRPFDANLVSGLELRDNNA